MQVVSVMDFHCTPLERAWCNHETYAAINMKGQGKRYEVLAMIEERHGQYSEFGDDKTDVAH